LKVSNYSHEQLTRRLESGELLLDLKPFVARIRSNIPGIARDIALMYAGFETCPEDAFADFHVAVIRESGLLNWMKPRARFYFDGRPSFIPLPVSQSFAMLEWGLNWCVAAHGHQYLIIHAAVIEREGRAAILPGAPGAGKSTLCAGLINRGWRLLSDELALLDLDSGLVCGMCRPVNLKNASIDVIRRFAPHAVMTGPVPDTTKGTIALMRPPEESIAARDAPARPAWIIVPDYSPEASPELAPHDRALAFMLLAEQSFNYDIHGKNGFAAVGRLIDACHCYRFSYSNLEDAVRIFDRLAGGCE